MSLDLDALKVFVRVAELGSFTQAAQQLRMPKARASAQVQKLEGALGAQLLQRSTRVVRTTAEGEALLKRARALLSDADEVGSMFQAGRILRGRVRIELPVVIAREHIIPRVPELLARHPQLQLQLSSSDRFVAAQREGFDIVLRFGPVSEPGLVMRRLGELSMMNCASPSYLREHGTPHTLADLQHHYLVHYASEPSPTFEYRDGESYRELPMRSLISVDSSDAYGAACIAGLGIIQVPRRTLTEYADKLVEILPELSARPLPVSLLHTHGRSVPRRVRAVMNWLVELLSPQFESTRTHASERRSNQRDA